MFLWFTPCLAPQCPPAASSASTQTAASLFTFDRMLLPLLVTLLIASRSRSWRAGGLHRCDRAFNCENADAIVALHAAL